MINIAVCLKLQKKAVFEKTSMWKNLPLSYLDICALNLANNLEAIEDTRVNVYTMGPLSHLDYLSELTEYGFGKINLVSDTKIAGADTLGTAKVLEKILLDEQEKIIIMGEHSDDSATGQVPIQVAGRMGYDLYVYTELYMLKDIIVKHKYKKGLVIIVNKKVDEYYPSLVKLRRADSEIRVVDGEKIGGVPFPIKYTDVVNISQSDIYDSNRERIDIGEGMNLINSLIERSGKYEHM